MNAALLKVRSILEGIGFQYIPRGEETVAPRSLMNREPHCRMGVRGFTVYEHSDGQHIVVSHVTTCNCLKLFLSAEEEAILNLWRSSLHTYASMLSIHSYECKVVKEQGQPPVLLVRLQSADDQPEEEESAPISDLFRRQIQDLIPKDFE